MSKNLFKNKKLKSKNSIVKIAISFFLMSNIAILCAQSEVKATNENSETNKDRTVYEIEFFTQYYPVTALDMVERIPGFSIDEGDRVRGFSGSAGNVLIDGQLPSSKSDDIEDILNRISKDNVEKIELYRGSTGNLHIGTEQSVVVNVIRKAERSGSATWEVKIKEESGIVTPTGNVSYSNVFKNTNYTVSLKRHAFDIIEKGTELLTTPNNASDEIRNEHERSKRGEWQVNVETETTFKNSDVLRFNGNFNTGDYRVNETSSRTLLAENIVDTFLLGFDKEDKEIETGVDYKHIFSPQLSVKSIFLFRREYDDSNRFIDIDREVGDSIRNRSVRDSTSGETIGRVEFDWSKWDDHLIQFGGEGVDNFVENEFQLFSLINGVEESINIPGANTEVSESRQEIFINDTWSVTKKLTLDLGVSIEFSEISQTGDLDNNRRFVFTQPSFNLTYAQTPKQQWRMKISREAGQLNFFDFISSNNFADDDVDFGNPDLVPEQTTRLEVAHTKQFGEIGLFEVLVFHDWIDDVQDLLPIGGISEVAGNIGNGKRYGTQLKMTLPLDNIGLKNTRIDSSYRYQKSFVTDPVLFTSRELSDERPERINFSIRKEMPSIKSNFEIDFFKISREKFYGLDEIETRGSFSRLNLEWNTTLNSGLNIAIKAYNILDPGSKRDRTVFDGSRSDNILRFREAQSRSNGGKFIWLTLSGTI